jgi:SAM-dependent methyltransferase
LSSTSQSSDFPGREYDLVAFFDCLHDMADPEAAARQAHATLEPDGAVLLVGPMAGERIEDNFNLVGRIYSAASVLVCTPNAIAGGGTGIGTIATDDDIRRIFTRAGFSHFRRATETPFNRIFEARP